MKNYYEILDIPYSAGIDEVRKAYRRKAKEHHPDAGAGTANGFMALSRAYEVLSDPVERRRYDRELGMKLRPAAETWADRVHVYAATRDVYDDLVELLADRFHWPRRQMLHFDLILTEEELEQGVNAVISVPQVKTCPRCFGFGGVLFSTCALCSGMGLLRSKLDFTLRVKPPIRIDDRLEVIEGDYVLRFRVRGGN